MSSVKTIITAGAHGYVIDAECHVSNGLPKIVIVGLVGKAVEESKERIRGAFASTKIPLPRKRIAINLAPADIPKDSTGMDLAIASAILIAGGMTKQTPGPTHAVLGELGLDGSVRPIRGIIGKILSARAEGITTFIIPAANLQQAKLIPDITLLAAQTIKEVYLYLNQELQLPRHTGQQRLVETVRSAPKPTLADIAGQTQAKRALAIVAAGGHNMLLYGPPGTGKSMLAKALMSLLPPLSYEEVLEVTHLHSLTTLKYDELLTSRPFRSPHHSSSHISIVGGGAKATPGEITLSHRGVLFLDEMPEFTHDTLESLRQPLEDKRITIARARHTLQYPANFILVATANPCPCGYYGSTHECTCTSYDILRYQRKLSGPILDRIDLHVLVDQISHSLLLEDHPGNSEELLRSQIKKARSIQHERLQKTQLNADMQGNEVKQHALLDSEARQLLDKAAAKLQLSPRSYMRIIKVARTIADLDAEATISTAHIGEALQYRPLNQFTA